jgi:hypothetical protein
MVDTVLSNTQSQCKESSLISKVDFGTKSFLPIECIPTF